MRRVAALLLFIPAMACAQADLANWVIEQGGSVKPASGSPIEEVKLDLDWIGDHDAARLATLKNLTSLDLSFTLLSDAGMESLKPLANVTVLNLYSVEHITDTGIAYIRGWKQLRHLNLRGTDITDTSMEYIAGLPALESLDVSYTQVTNNGLEYLPALSQLETLSLGGNKISSAGLPVLKALPKLKSLNLSGAQKRNSGTWAVTLTDLDMTTLGELNRLESLNMAGLRITDPNLTRLKNLALLRDLDLSRTEVTGAGLSALSSFPHLQKLNLWNLKRVEDSAIPALLKLNKLALLDLAGTGVTDRGLELLGAIPSLRRLYLTGSRVTDAGVREFQRAHPDCLVSYK